MLLIINTSARRPSSTWENVVSSDEKLQEQPEETGFFPPDPV
eukprot:gene15316-4585_t